MAAHSKHDADFSYVMDVRDGMIRDVTVELFQKVKRMPSISAVESAQIDIAIEALQRMPKGSRPFGNRMWLFSLSWPRQKDMDREFCMKFVFVLDNGVLFLFHSIDFIPFEDPAKDCKVYFSWDVIPGDRFEVYDKFHEVDNIRGLLPFHAAVREFDPTHPEVECEINLDEPYDAPMRFPDQRLDTHGVPEPESTEEWLLKYASAARGELFGIFRIPPPIRCDICRVDFANETLLIDGRLRRGMLWADMCPRCAIMFGAGLGEGNGQLFLRRKDGKWLCIDGFPFEEADEEDLDGEEGPTHEDDET